jgi:hypothetical protein
MLRLHISLYMLDISQIFHIILLDYYAAKRSKKWKSRGEMDTVLFYSCTFFS